MVLKIYGKKKGKYANLFEQTDSNKNFVEVKNSPLLIRYMLHYLDRLEITTKYGSIDKVLLV